MTAALIPFADHILLISDADSDQIHSKFSELLVCSLRMFEAAYATRRAEQLG